MILNMQLVSGMLIMKLIKNHEIHVLLLLRYLIKPRILKKQRSREETIWLY